MTAFQTRITVTGTSSPSDLPQGPDGVIFALCEPDNKRAVSFLDGQELFHHEKSAFVASFFRNVANSVNPRHRKLLLGPYDKRVINNTHRAHFVECLIALALGQKWQLTWQQCWDWAAWDLENQSGVRLEVKQAAARQSWDRPPGPPQRIPRFDIAPREGYWPRDGREWKRCPGRHADIYVFAWHGEAEAELCDQRNAYSIAK